MVVEPEGVIIGASGIGLTDTVVYTVVWHPEAFVTTQAYCV